MIQIKRFRYLLRFSGLFNIVLAFPLIVPEFYRMYIDFICVFNRSLGLGGIEPVLPTDGLSQLLINTSGIDLVLIGSIVFASSYNPIKFRIVPMLNAIGRTLFVIVVIYYVIEYDVIRFILIIALLDVLISIGFFYYLYQTRERKFV